MREREREKRIQEILARCTLDGKPVTTTGELPMGNTPFLSSLPPPSEAVFVHDWRAYEQTGLLIPVAFSPFDEAEDGFNRVLRPKSFSPNPYTHPLEEQGRRKMQMSGAALLTDGLLRMQEPFLSASLEVLLQEPDEILSAGAIVIDIAQGLSSEKTTGSRLKALCKPMELVGNYLEEYGMHLRTNRDTEVWPKPEFDEFAGKLRTQAKRLDISQLPIPE